METNKNRIAVSTACFFDSEQHRNPWCDFVCVRGLCFWLVKMIHEITRTLHEQIMTALCRIFVSEESSDRNLIANRNLGVISCVFVDCVSGLVEKRSTKSHEHYTNKSW